MMRDAYNNVNRSEDTMTLVAGDFVPAIDALRNDGYRVEVVFSEHASQELKDACDKFVSLNPYLAHLSI